MLGPVQVRDSTGRQVSVGGPRPRALTCALVAEAGRVVSVDRLIDRVWGGQPPPAAVGTLYAYVSQLRKLLDPLRRGNATSGVISTTGSGYLLHATPAEVDASLFEILVEKAESAPPGEALDKVDEALTLWRGEPYVDLGDSPDLAGLTQPLVELRLRAFELRIGALLELGRTGPAASAARSLVREQPLREPYWRHLMLATYRDGHQADALAAYLECRRFLDRELGMSPDADTEALHTAILRRDPGLRPGVAEATPVRLQPRTGQPAPPVGLEMLIGRDPQLARINDALHAMNSGSGWLLVLEGEAGIGKTRLAEAARDLAEARGVRTVWSSTMRDMAAPPLWPWEQVLRALGLPAPIAESPGDDPATARFRLCQRIADAILDASRQQPLLIVLDDVHWADAPSLHVLRLLAAQLNRHRCVLVTTRRTGDGTVDPAVDATVAALDREHTVRRVPIPPLTVDQVGAMLGRYAAHAAVDPAAVHRRTGGNLFYLVELVRLYESGNAADTEVPSSVQAVVEQRHDQLPADTRAVLRLAALGGAELDLGCSPRPGTPTPPPWSPRWSRPSGPGCSVARRRRCAGSSPTISPGRRWPPGSAPVSAPRCTACWPRRSPGCTARTRRSTWTIWPSTCSTPRTAPPRRRRSWPAARRRTRPGRGWRRIGRPATGSAPWPCCPPPTSPNGATGRCSR